jgi:hypothetical protein
MAVVKTLGAGILAWVAMGSMADAAPMSWAGGGRPLLALRAARIGATDGAEDPTASVAEQQVSVPVAAPTIVPQTAWWNSPRYAVAGAASVSDSPAPAPATVSYSPTVTPTVAPAAVDAYINMGSGPYPSETNLTTGGGQPWYYSPSAIEAFKGLPSPQQQQDFTAKVLDDVQKTFQLSGLDPSLTTDPNVPALHTLSVVSNTSYGLNPGAIGITDIGGNGFTLMDKLAYANSPDELATAVAHNVTHELMHAFGVGIHPDSTGEYLDTSAASWALLTDPKAALSPEASRLVQSNLDFTHNARSLAGMPIYSDGGATDGQQLVQPVPEPATLVSWGVMGVLAGLWVRRLRAQETVA